MSEICQDKAHCYCLMAADPYDISWHHFMEGMVCHHIQSIQGTYSSVEFSTVPLNQWAQALVIKLLEATHGQWSYRCV
jgi:hypothetical protein